VMWKNKPFFFLQKLRFSKAVKNMVWRCYHANGRQCEKKAFAACSVCFVTGNVRFFFCSSGHWLSIRDMFTETLTLFWILRTLCDMGDWLPNPTDSTAFFFDIVLLSSRPEYINCHSVTFSRL
jgi:hypothetical protein